MNIKENLDKILNEINNTVNKIGRPENCVKLLAVSKFHPVESIIQAIQAGQINFGENRVQEAGTKFSQIYQNYPDINLHIIGQLQSNKVKKAIQIANCIESVDKLDLIKEIEKHAQNLNKKINILFELHTAEDSKSGFENTDKIKESLDYILENTKFVNPIGFMTMAPFTNDEKLIRKSFITLKNAQETLQKDYPELNLTELSMGMSNDYKIAIEEGSTQIRVGTAIFGERNY